MADETQARVRRDPTILGGQPTVRGVPLATLLRELAGGCAPSDLLGRHPDLEPADLEACFAYAAQVFAPVAAAQDDQATLAPADPGTQRPRRVLAAAWLGKTRLIDNVPV